MKKITSTLFKLLFCVFINAQISTVLESIDIEHYKLELDFTLIKSKLVSGKAEIVFSSLNSNLSQFELDLLGLKVDSITQHNQQLNFNLNKDKLHIVLSKELPSYSKDSLTIHYHGKPIEDTYWGGFYFMAPYAFNMGVGFDALPHNFGRVWFPCIDNFTDRAKYTITTITDTKNSSFCSGRLVKDELTKNTHVQTWHLEKSIPTYLASVAIAPYTSVKWNFNNKEDKNIPILLAALEADTSNFKTSFTNLIPCLKTFENMYGAYQWPRIGFTAVPFSSGAMEHACNIAYPLYAIDGTTKKETLMAHELSHHWWGNLITCRSAEEMWLNEGWASYSEHTFIEGVYGKTAFEKAVKENFYNVIRYTAFDDKGNYALNAVPQRYTYGSHSYNKGAAIAHSFRTFMGESTYLNTIDSIMEAYAFKDVGSEDLKNIASYFKADAATFFEDWVFQPGFPVVQITSWNYKNGEIQLTLRQDLKNALHAYSKIPIKVSYLKSNKTWEDKWIELTSIEQEFSIQCSEKPLDITINRNSDMAIGTTYDEINLKNNGNVSFNHALVNCKINKNSDSLFLRCEHIWKGPRKDTYEYDFLINPNRYWRIIGDPKDSIVENIKFTLNATNTRSGNLDNDFFKAVPNFREDSVSIIYRNKPGAPWKIIPTSIYFKDALSDGYNYYQTNYNKYGEYALAYRGLKTPPYNNKELESFEKIKISKKTEKSIEIKLNKKGIINTITLIDFKNNIVFERTITNKKKVLIDKITLEKGNYILLLTGEKNYTVRIKV